MNTADAARRKHFDTRATGDPAGRCNRRRAVPTFGHCDRQISRADFSDAVFFGELAYLFRAESDFQFSGEYPDRGRHSAAFANDPFESPRGLEIYRPRQTVRGHRRFERDHSLIIRQGRCDFGSYVNHAFLISVKTVPPFSRGSHEIRASINPARAFMFASPRPSELWLFVESNGRPLSSMRSAKSPAAEVSTNIFTSVASACRQMLFTASCTMR